MSHNGEEMGVFCNKENSLCVDQLRTRRWRYPMLRQVRPRAAREKFYFRYLGGPQDSLAWMLDPERGDVRRAIWRMRQCVVGLQAEDYDGYLRVLGWHFPWIHEVRRAPVNGSRSSGPAAGSAAGSLRNRVSPRSAAVRGNLTPQARAIIAEFNWRDMRIYRAARRQFRQQLARIKRASGGRDRRPPVAYSTEEGVQAAASERLRHMSTFQVHDRLNRFMMGLPM